MKIEQIITTKIIAEDGKILRKKSSGAIYGTSCSLGYNYYELGVGLSQPHLSTPADFEEIDIPEDYEVKPPVDHVKRLKRTSQLIEQNIREMNDLPLSTLEALEVKDWFPKWGTKGFREGDMVEAGIKFQYEGKLYAVKQDHTIMPFYYPSEYTPSLYVEVTPDYVEELGIKRNPIPFEDGMKLVSGKYYSQNGVIYLCNTDTEEPVYGNLANVINVDLR